MSFTMSSPSSAVVVLFYRYFLPTTSPTPTSSTPDDDDGYSVVDEATLRLFRSHSSHYLPLLRDHQRDLLVGGGGGGRDGVVARGRLLLSREGVNGTLSFPSRKDLGEYVTAMEAFDLLRDLGPPPPAAGPTGNDDGEERTGGAGAVPKAGGGRLFAGIDWKTSDVDVDENGNDATANNNAVAGEPFPDLKIQLVKEIVNTGGLVDVNDIPDDSGREICPEEFHRILMEAQSRRRRKVGKDDGEDEKKEGMKDVVLIDVRNTFEHSIGHFLHPRCADDGETTTPDDETTTQDGEDSSGVGTAAVVEAKDASIHDANHGSTRSAEEECTTKTITDDDELTLPSPAPALNPNTVTFSHFDSTFVSRNAQYLKDKRVLMYCTGGIRCVKASAMLKKRGIEDVSHLKGGIHRYVEKYGNDGFWKGKLFVFDKRVALDPDSMMMTVPTRKRREENEKADEVGEKEGREERKGPREKITDKRANDVDSRAKVVVGKCIECRKPHDKISGAILCSVCRDLVLMCPSCKEKLNEYHCERHRPWKDTYFTFLERYTAEELRAQHHGLQQLHDKACVPGEGKNKNVRRTLRKQMDKVRARIEDLENGRAEAEGCGARRRCRTCFEPEDVCDGLCWGFWRSLQSPYQVTVEDRKPEPILKVKAGDRVTPGPNWNALRHGSRCHPAPGGPCRKEKRRRKDDDKSTNGQQSQESISSENNGEIARVGTVVEVKSWASGGNEMDCVAVTWDADPDIRCRGKKISDKDDDAEAVERKEIYRWGTVSRNGQRLYDVKLVP